MSNVNPIALKLLEGVLSLFENVYIPIYSHLKAILLGNSMWAGETTALFLLASAFTIGYLFGRDIRVRQAGSIIAFILWVWFGLVIISALGV
ncbi:membrane protein of unknown function (plasmid) [Thermococcus nautili]|uniref:hypothetical protein n=1 Tax=Thermococcus nautili TaxID=195522 RepID=UPI0025548295|nr:hypothetical protein [Thermococcus nautili]CAI1494131.1 membrane protein of unknown function [Thermococcus nautili]